MRSLALIAMAVIGMLALSGCAPKQELIKQTASGYPEGVFQNTTTEEVVEKIISGCTAKGLMVIETNPHQVVCEKKLKGKDAVIASLAIGNSYSTTPVAKIRFVMYRDNGNVKVVGYQWIETQFAYGQVRKLELTANHQKNDVQKFIQSLGAI